MLSDLARQADMLENCGFSRDRLRAPGDVVARIRRRFAEFGITRLAETTTLDEVGWPVWAAVRPNAPTLSVCQGKGATVVAAQASAVMEAVEVSVAERVEPHRIASAAQLDDEGRAYDFLPSMLLEGRRHPLPTEPIAWVLGHDLGADAAVHVPLQAVQIDGADPARAYWQSTDGIGSGSLMLEAVTHGLFERVERDAVELAQWRTDDEVEASCIDVDALASSDLAGIASAVSTAGLHLRAFDVTSDIGIPAVFATVSPVPTGRETEWHHFDLASGSAARLDIAAAAVAAIGEALQSRLTVISGARDDFQPEVYERRIAEDLLVYPRARPVHRPPCCATLRPRGLEAVLNRLRDRGVSRVIVVPLHEDEDVAVAKVVVPDLELPPGPRAVPHGPRVRRAAGAQA